MSPVSESTQKRKDDAAGRLGGTADIQRKTQERDINWKKRGEKKGQGWALNKGEKTHWWMKSRNVIYVRGKSFKLLSCRIKWKTSLFLFIIVCWGSRGSVLSQHSTERWLPSDLIHQFRIECEIWALIGILNINTCINSTRWMWNSHILSYMHFVRSVCWGEGH